MSALPLKADIQTTAKCQKQTSNQTSQSARS